MIQVIKRPEISEVQSRGQGCSSDAELRGLALAPKSSTGVLTGCRRWRFWLMTVLGITLGACGGILLGILGAFVPILGNDNDFGLWWTIAYVLSVFAHSNLQVGQRYLGSIAFAVTLGGGGASTVAFLVIGIVAATAAVIIAIAGRRGGAAAAVSAAVVTVLIAVIGQLGTSMLFAVPVIVGQLLAAWSIRRCALRGEQKHKWLHRTVVLIGGRCYQAR